MRRIEGRAGLAILACGAVVFARHVAGYFFLFDDFGLVASARDASLSALFATSSSGFYRPVGLALLKTEFALFGWSHPGGYALVAVAMHAVNAALVRQLFVPLDRSLGSAASIVFWLVPFAGEAVFWVSACFDLLATMGVLGTLLCARVLIAPPDARSQGLAAAGALVASCGALLAKESAVVLPPLLVADALLTGRWGAATRARRLGLVVSAAAVVGAYLGLRGTLLPGLGGAYGSFADLIAGADVAANCARYLQSLAVLPHPAGERLGALATGWLLVRPCALVVVPVVVITGLRRDRRAAIAGLAFLVSLTPVLWTSTAPPSTAGGRFLYLPGVWASAVLGAGLGLALARARAPHRLRRVALLGGVALLTAYWLASLSYQQRLWAGAADLSRQAMQQFVERAPGGARLHLANLPSRCVEGPVVLKAHAFPAYAGRDVRARGLVVTCDPAVGIRAVGLSPEDAATLQEGEVSFRFAPPLPAFPE
jgi:hypothetical protein